jgi:ribosomal protein L14E/L6E/L27E
MEDIKKIQEFFSKPLNEQEDAVDTITMDVPLFIRMLEYAREDAQEDVDLHDVTEKANLLGKERGILQMEDYNEIVGAAEDIKETETPIGMLNRLNPNKSLKVGDITTFSSGKYKGKKVKIVKDLGDGRFELEIVGVTEDIKETETPIGMLNRLNPNKSLKVGDITTFSSGKYKGKKVKIVKDLGDGRFELEIVGAAEDTPIQEMIKSVLNGKGIKRKK